MSAHRKPRASSKALVPGISAFAEARGDGYPRWRVRAVAQVDGKQVRSDWSPLRHSLAGAVREASAWRAEHVPAQGAAAEIEAAVWGRLSPAVLSQMRAAGVDVRRPAPVEIQSTARR
ncbi:MAG: hypothetical protein JWM27_4743 [Gemmatimonadetes bacterium]|nr:hypothetical protein [Gemmatimonadota bacterium]